MSKPIMFAVPVNITSVSECEIIVGYIHKNNKNSYNFVRTGQYAGTHVHMHKDKWILFGNLLGVRAHIEKEVEKNMKRLEDIREQWYEVLDTL